MENAGDHAPATLEHQPRAWLMSRCAGTPWRLSVWAAQGDYVERANPRPQYFPHYSLHLVTAGAIEYVIDERSTTVRKHQLVLFPRRTNRYATNASRSGASLAYAHFEPALDRPDPLRAVRLPLVVTMQKPAAASRAMSRLVRHIGKPEENPLLAQAELLRVLHMLIVDGFHTGQLRIASDHAYPDALIRGMQIIEKNVLNPGLTLQRVADEAGVSQGHFTRLFRGHVGVPPKTYIMRRRLDEAMSLVLTSPHMSIHEIAACCGYTDPFYFSLQFRKRFGRPPTKFRPGS